MQTRVHDRQLLEQTCSKLRPSKSDTVMDPYSPYNQSCAGQPAVSKRHLSELCILKQVSQDLWKPMLATVCYAYMNDPCLCRQLSSVKSMVRLVSLSVPQ